MGRVSDVRGAPGGTPRSRLAQRLRDEGAIFDNHCNVPSHDDCGGHNGLAYINHILRHKTSGNVTQMIWSHRDSTLQHQFVTFCVSIPGYSEFSWLRIERLGDIAGSTHPKRRSAGLSITLAADQRALEQNGDKEIAKVEFNTTENLHRSRGLPTLVDLAHFIKTVHNEYLYYTLIRFNCWWFARNLFRSLVTELCAASNRRRLLLSTCETQRSKHITAPHRHATGWVCLASFLGLGTAGAVSPILGVVAGAVAGPILGGGLAVTYLGVFGRTWYHLSRSEKKIQRKIDGYLEARPLRSS